MLTKKSIMLCCLLLCLWLNSAFAQTLNLSAEEQAYLDSEPKVRMCVDPDWMPYEALDSQGRHIGLVSEYMALISTRLNLALPVVATSSWKETQDLYESGACDVVSALNITPERAKYLVFTEPFIKSPAVLVLENSNVQTKELADLEGRNLGMIEGHVYETRLREDYPGIQIIYQPNMEAALQKVSSGELDATIGPLFLVFHLTQELHLENVKVIGSSEYKDELSIGIKKGNTVLAGVLNKAITSLSQEDHSLMRRTWMNKAKH